MDAVCHALIACALDASSRRLREPVNAAPIPDSEPGPARLQRALSQAQTIASMPSRFLFSSLVRWACSATAPALLVVVGAPAWAADGAVVKTDQARAELVAHAPQGIKAGAEVWLGLKIEHQPHWHTYWKNPGDSGLPTTLAFSLPAGFGVGEIVWPTPKPLPVGPLVNFGYEGSLLLPVPVSVPATWQGDALEVKLRADWLICKDVCIPEGGDFVLRIPSQSATALHGGLFSATQAAVPKALSVAEAVGTLSGNALMVSVNGLPAAWRGKPLSFLPELAGVIDNAAKPVANWQGERWTAQVPLSAQRSESPAAMPVVLVAAGEPVGAQVQLTVKGAWPAAVSAEVPRPAPPPAVAPENGGTAAPDSELSFWSAWVLAFGGGLLLNLMPCVFPVLSLKVLGFAAHAHQRRKLLTGGLAYTAGVVLSFLALAGLLMALRAGGEQLGWGFQLQSPAFVAALAALFTLIGLNLAGVFELGSLLPSSLATARARHPVVDSALTGVLAVAVASPCTAPFMGASLGLAATLPAPQALGIFAALGLGMAAPYLAASAWPPLARALPRPGVWMQHFKTLMAFPMWATVVWLLWVLGHQTSVDTATALLGVLLALSFAAWALGSPTLGKKARRGISSVALVCLALALMWALPSLRQDGADSAAARFSSDPADASTLWQPWSSERVQSSLAAGRPVFVDFTAAWCVTCQFNKRTVLNQTELLADMRTRQVVLLRADWTRRDAAITAELARMGRNGVPVYALYDPARAQPRILSEILTVRDVRDALGALP